jgi:hypothetical protein
MAEQSTWSANVKNGQISLTACFLIVDASSVRGAPYGWHCILLVDVGLADVVQQVAGPVKMEDSSPPNTHGSNPISPQLTYAAHWSRNPENSAEAYIT